MVIHLLSHYLKILTFCKRNRWFQKISKPCSNGKEIGLQDVGCCTFNTFCDLAFPADLSAESQLAGVNPCELVTPTRPAGADVPHWREHWRVVKHTIKNTLNMTAHPLRIVSDNQNTLNRNGVYIHNRYYILDTRFSQILIVLYIAFQYIADIPYWILYVEYMLDLICWTNLAMTLYTLYFYLWTCTLSRVVYALLYSSLNIVFCVVVHSIVYLPNQTRIAREVDVLIIVYYMRFNIRRNWTYSSGCRPQADG